MRNKISIYVFFVILSVMLIFAVLYTSYNKEKSSVMSPNSAENTKSVWYEPMRITFNSYDRAEKEGPPPESEGLDELKDIISEYIAGRNGDWGVYIKNIKSNEYLSLNERDYSSASLIKLFTMAAVFNELEAGTFAADENITSNLELMICESDNTACNYLTKRLGGGDTIQGFETENKHTASLGCSYTNHGSELVDGKGRVIFTGYNKTSPRDCGIVLEGIYRGVLVSPDASAAMLDLLFNQTRTWKIPESLPENARAANKTGETDTTEGDAAIVYSPACNYIICVIGNGNMSGGIETIQTVSKMTYDYFNPPS